MPPACVAVLTILGLAGVVVDAISSSKSSSSLSSSSSGFLVSSSRGLVGEVATDAGAETEVTEAGAEPLRGGAAAGFGMGSRKYCDAMQKGRRCRW